MKEYIIDDFISLNENEIDTDNCYIEFDNDIKERACVSAQKGVSLGKVALFKVVGIQTREYAGYIQLFAPENAIYDFTILLNLFPGLTSNSIAIKKLIDEKVIICRSYSDYNELANMFMIQNCGYKIVDDVFNKKKQIVWEHNYIRLSKVTKSSAFQLRFFPVERPYFRHFPFVRLGNSKEQFVFQFEKNEFLHHKLVKNDSIHFVFDNNEHLSFQLKNAASNTTNTDYKQVSFAMLPQDIQLFASQNLIAIRFEFCNGDEPVDLKRENEFASLTFMLYFQKYIEALSECGVSINSVDCELKREGASKKKLTTDYKEGSCFVYLMKDESNGFHKIGISYKPEYRERTLQSEKPTIILLSAKEYPTRIIAEAIEAALHKAFEAKRLRGEWFSLDEKDVEDIIKTLS